MIDQSIAILEKRITQTVMQQYTWIEKSKSVNILQADQVYQLAATREYYELCAVITDGLYPEILQRRDYWMIKRGITGEMRVSIDRMISENVNRSQKLAGQVFSKNGKNYIAEMCPACNGKRIMSIDHPLEACPICPKDIDTDVSLGIVLTEVKS